MTIKFGGSYSPIVELLLGKSDHARGNIRVEVAVELIERDLHQRGSFTSALAPKPERSGVSQSRVDRKFLQRQRRARVTEKMLSRRERKKRLRAACE